jgi:hypothetical protein
MIFGDQLSRYSYEIKVRFTPALHLINIIVKCCDISFISLQSLNHINSYYKYSTITLKTGF